MKEGRVVAADVKYLSNQMVCHKSGIDDNDMDLCELVGTVDIIKEEVLKFTRMNQCSHF